MKRRQIKTGERYLFRLNGRQVPVLLESKGSVYRMRRLDTGEVLQRKHVRTLDLHYDACLPITGNCLCAERLRAANAAIADG